MPRSLAIALLVIAALALPAAMAGAALYASNAAIVNPSGELTPQFGKAAPHPRSPARTPHHKPASRRTTAHHAERQHGTTSTGSANHGSTTGSSTRWNSGSQHWSSGSHSSDRWSGHRSSGGWDT